MKVQLIDELIDFLFFRRYNYSKKKEKKKEILSGASIGVSVGGVVVVQVKRRLYGSAQHLVVVLLVVDEGVVLEAMPQIQMLQEVGTQQRRVAPGHRSANRTHL